MVMRKRLLPRGLLRGRYRASDTLVAETRRALSTFYEAGRGDGGHEGICFWAGLEGSDVTTLEAVIVPVAQHGPHGVFVSAVEFGNAAEQAHSMGLGILAQVHSHPGADTRHSDGDDELVVMPFENMLSVVAPFYGRTVRSIRDFSVHQFQDHRWVLCSTVSVMSKFRGRTRAAMAAVNAERERFYRERDARTVDYLERDWPVGDTVSVEAGDDACLTPAGQLVLLTLVNQLMRSHREVHVSVSDPDATILVPSVCGGASLGDEMVKLASQIDPYGQFRVETQSGRVSDVSIGVGEACRKGLDWYLGCDRCTAELAARPLSLGCGTSADLRGAGAAAVLGAAAAMKTVLGIQTVPRKLSVWNLREGDSADPGPPELPSMDVGRTLMIGAGAVATGVVYWLMQWGQRGPWTIVDGDYVELHNTNRCVLFFPDDAGWLGGQARFKSACLAEYLTEVRHVEKWYDETPETEEEFDTVLVLANERGVRTQVSHRNDPIQFQATTSRNWVAQLHRHIVGVDGCVRCRMSEILTPKMECSEGATATPEKPQRPDAALPFLSLASGLILVSALQHLQLGEFGTCPINRWDWDFKSAHQMDASGTRRCRDDCTMVLSSEARRHIASATCWHDQDWLQGDFR